MNDEHDERRKPQRQGPSHEQNRGRQHGVQNVPPNEEQT
jgi:hypothetical protein